MIHGLQPYPKVKSTAVSWLPAIPAHWEVWRNGRLFVQRRQTGFPDLPILEITIRNGVQKRDFDSGARKQQMTDRSKYQRATQGDIAYNMMRMWQGAIGVVPLEGLVSPAYVVARPQPEADGRYFAYLFRTADYMGEVATYSRGIVPDRNRLYWESYKQLASPVPPIEEQRLIVRFLDAHGALTTRLIRAKQRVVKLLEEQKQAIIHRAVTRGLDPSVRLKPSGIRWLGDIPEHWELRKLKHLTRFHNGLAFKPSDWAGAGTPIIRIQNLNGSNIFNYTVRNDLPNLLRIRRGDLLFSWSGNRGTSFGSFLWDRDVEGFLNQHIFKLDGYSLHRRYFAHLLRAVTRRIEEETHGIIGLVHVTKPELGSTVVPVAAATEQEVIARWIDDEIARPTASIDLARREIVLLREFRSRLIADVVTGKFDVRTPAAALPETTEEPPLLDDTEETGDEAPEDADEPDLEEVAA